MPDIQDLLMEDILIEETVSTSDALSQAIANAKNCQNAIINLDGEDVEGLIGTCVSILKAENVQNVVYKITAEGQMTFEADVHLSTGSRIIIRALCINSDSDADVLGCSIPDNAEPLVDINIGNFRFKPVGDTLIYTEPLNNGEIQIHFVEGDGRLEVHYNGEILGILIKGQDASLDIVNHILTLKEKVDNVIIAPQIEELEEKSVPIKAETSVPKNSPTDGCHSISMAPDAISILPILYVLFKKLQISRIPETIRNHLIKTTLSIAARVARATNLLDK